MKNAPIIICAIIGSVIGVFVVKTFYFNSLESFGWGILWNNLSSLNYNIIKFMSESETFRKILSGAIIGGGLGAVAGYMLNKNLKFFN
jgi:hypothetical protein